MGSIYIKKLTKQDITRSYSPNTEATRDFFDIDLDNKQALSIKRIKEKIA